MIIGLSCKYECEPLQLCEVKLRFVNQIKYLWIYIYSAKHFNLAYDNCKLKFCRCFNAIYSKRKGHNCEIVSVELLKLYCIPIVLYATDAAYPDKTSLKRLDTLVDTAVHKILKIFGEQVSCDIIKVVGLRNLKEIIDERQSKFRRKIKSSNVIQTQIAYDYLTNFICMY